MNYNNNKPYTSATNNNRFNKNKNKENDLFLTIILIVSDLAFITGYLTNSSHIFSPSIQIFAIVVITTFILSKHHQFVKNMIYSKLSLMNQVDKQVRQKNQLHVQDGKYLKNVENLNYSNILNNSVQPSIQEQEIIQNDYILDNQQQFQYEESHIRGNLQDSVQENFNDQQNLNQSENNFQQQNKQNLKSISLKTYLRKGGNSKNINKEHDIKKQAQVDGIHQKPSSYTDISKSKNDRKASVSRTHITSITQARSQQQSYYNEYDAKVYDYQKVDTYLENERQNFKNFYSETFQNQNEKQLTHYLQHSINDFINNILHQVILEQNNNIIQINSILKNFNIALKDVQAICQEDQYQINNLNLQYQKLDDLLIEQTSITLLIEKQQIERIRLAYNKVQKEQLAQSLQTNKEDLYSCIQERINILDPLLTIQNYDLRKCRLYILERINAIINGNILIERAKQITLKNEYPSDIQILFNLIKKYFNNKLHNLRVIVQNELNNNIDYVESIIEYNLQDNSQIIFNDNLQKIINSFVILYEDRYVSYISVKKRYIHNPNNKKDNQNQKMVIEQKNMRDTLFEGVYFVKKSPHGCELEMDVYSNGDHMVTLPGEHNFNCCIYFYAKTIMKKIQLMEKQMEKELKFLRHLQIFRDFQEELSNIDSNIDTSLFVNSSHEGQHSINQFRHQNQNYNNMNNSFATNSNLYATFGQRQMMNNNQEFQNFNSYKRANINSKYQQDQYSLRNMAGQSAIKQNF